MIRSPSTRAQMTSQRGAETSWKKCRSGRDISRKSENSKNSKKRSRNTNREGPEQKGPRRGLDNLRNPKNSDDCKTPGRDPGTPTETSWKKCWSGKGPGGAGISQGTQRPRRTLKRDPGTSTENSRSKKGPGGTQTTRGTPRTQRTSRTLRRDLGTSKREKKKRSGGGHLRTRKQARGQHKKEQ